VVQVTRQVAQGIADAALIVGVELGSGVGHALILPAGVQANPLMIPANNDTTCPGGTSYAGAGCCKVC
jgi:TRAP-type mannitol/chloroaromatic compound transport system permease large subunit